MTCKITTNKSDKQVFLLKKIKKNKCLIFSILKSQKFWGFEILNFYNSGAALGIGAASFAKLGLRTSDFRLQTSDFFERGGNEASKDRAESPTASPERPKENWKLKVENWKLVISSQSSELKVQSSKFKKKSVVCWPLTVVFFIFAKKMIWIKIWIQIANSQQPTAIVRHRHFSDYWI